MINPASVAFDVDGVLADTMTLFLDIAREEFNIHEIRYEDFTSYNLEECIRMDPVVQETIISRIVNGGYAAELRAFDGAAEVLTRLGRQFAPLLFVTARPHSGPIDAWIRKMLPLSFRDIQIVATGAYEAKADVLLQRRISYFIEDRIETCFALDSAGITPVLFRQPWNRRRHPFREVGSWRELEALIDFK